MRLPRKDREHGLFPVHALLDEAAREGVGGDADRHPDPERGDAPHRPGALGEGDGREVVVDERVRLQHGGLRFGGRRSRSIHAGAHPASVGGSKSSDSLRGKAGPALGKREPEAGGGPVAERRGMRSVPHAVRKPVLGCAGASGGRAMQVIGAAGILPGIDHPPRDHFFANGADPVVVERRPMAGGVSLLQRDELFVERDVPVPSRSLHLQRGIRMPGRARTHPADRF